MNANLTKLPLAPHTSGALRYERVAMLEAVLTVREVKAAARLKRYFLIGFLTVALVVAVVVAV
ncbi:MAG: hypothetical protein GY826_07425 [Fuerstiella sp.]|nr:hypothetical protein [Fuerstiella sp.]